MEFLMNKDEALKMAIDLLDLYNNHIYRTGNANDVINACKEALEQPAQECKWCKSSEVNFDDWGDEEAEARADVIAQNGNDGLHYEEKKDE